jgi:hypothetical protein
MIDDIKQYYSVGDYLESNCTSNSSIPPAQLEWWINDVPAHIEHIIKYKTIVDPISNRETSILGLRLPLTNEHFYQGRLKVSYLVAFIAHENAINCTISNIGKIEFSIVLN